MVHVVLGISPEQSENSLHVPPGEQTRVCFPHLPQGRCSLVSGMQGGDVSATLVSDSSLVSVLEVVSMPAESNFRTGATSERSTLLSLVAQPTRRGSERK